MFFPVEGECGAVEVEGGDDFFALFKEEAV